MYVKNMFCYIYKYENIYNRYILMLTKNIDTLIYKNTFENVSLIV